jgi:hypothetical protein
MCFFDDDNGQSVVAWVLKQVGADVDFAKRIWNNFKDKMDSL